MVRVTATRPSLIVRGASAARADESIHRRGDEAGTDLVGAGDAGVDLRQDAGAQHAG
jgi:hypothetical protein